MKPLALVGVLALAGCGGPTQYLKSGYQAPGRVAVLPLNNHSTDLDGPVVVRYWFDQRLKTKKGYDTLSLAGIDEALKGLGITDGGQLNAVTPQKLGSALGADALVYGELLEFNNQTTGFLNVRKVRGRFKMIDAKTGEQLWEGEGLGSAGNATLSPAEALIRGGAALGEKLVEKAIQSPLRGETLDMVWNAMEYLPKAR